MPASKKTTKKGKFIELACKKAFRNFLHTPLNEKEADRPKKGEKLNF